MYFYLSVSFPAYRMWGSIPISMLALFSVNTPARTLIFKNWSEK